MTLDQIRNKAIFELKKSGFRTAELDVWILLEQVLKKDRSYILTHNLEPMTNVEYARFRRLIRRRKAGEPIAYITGHKEFFGYDFYVNKNVLIPRPETELLAENALHFLELKIKNNELRGRKELKILDIGTGSGCIIISLMLKAKSYKLKASFFAFDISKKALYVARKNARLHKVNNDIRFFHSDLFANKRMPKKYDVIIANLPYVANKSKIKNQKSKISSGIFFEPRDAIFAPDNGTKIIKRFLEQAKDRINENGLILAEVDPRNAKNILDFARNLYKESNIELIKDLAQLDRMIKILIK